MQDHEGLSHPLREEVVWLGMLVHLMFVDILKIPIPSHPLFNLDYRTSQSQTSWPVLELNRRETLVKSGNQKGWLTSPALCWREET